MTYFYGCSVYLLKIISSDGESITPAICISANKGKKFFRDYTRNTGYRITTPWKHSYTGNHSYEARGFAGDKSARFIIHEMYLRGAAEVISERQWLEEHRPGEVHAYFADEEPTK